MSKPLPLKIGSGVNREYGLAALWQGRALTFWIAVDRWGTYWRCGPPWMTKLDTLAAQR